MKTAIMQPYFMPYIGYWQLINAVDNFVLYDDVNYIKKGWINRNRIIVNKKEYLFTLSLDQVSQNKKINELYFHGEKSKHKLWKSIEFSYSNSKEWYAVNDILKKIVLNEEMNLSKYIENAVRMVCDYLEINTSIIVSSDIQKNNKKNGQDKIIDICEKLNTDIYINPSGGSSLYNGTIFKEHGMRLKFLIPQLNAYEQNADRFIEGLSLIDMMCCTSQQEIKQQLNQYKLVEE